MPVQRKGMRALQIWCSRVTSDYHSIEISDLSTSFRNGLAFVGIIHHFRPDLITHPDKLDPEDVIGNNDLAYKVAESKLEVPSLLDSEDMLASEEPDKFSIVTYLAQFYHLFKNESNISPNVSLHLSSESDSDVAATPPLGRTPTGTPTSNKKTFDRNDLIEKYGEELFSNDKTSTNNTSNNKSNITSNVTNSPLLSSTPPSSKNNKIIEEEDEGVVVNMRVTRPKRLGGVASMCKSFEMKAKIGVEK